MAPREQPRAEGGQVTHVLEAARHAGNAVPVRSEAYVVRTRDPDGVIEVIEQHLERGLRDRVLAKELGARRALRRRVVCAFAQTSQRLRPLAEVRADLGVRRFVDVGGIEVDHQDAAVPGEAAQHVVAHVARMVGEGAAR